MKCEFFSTDFQKILKYQISWKSIQWEPSCSVRSDGQTDTYSFFAILRKRLIKSDDVPTYYKATGLLMHVNLVLYFGYVRTVC